MRAEPETATSYFLQILGAIESEVQLFSFPIPLVLYVITI